MNRQRAKKLNQETRQSRESEKRRVKIQINLDSVSRIKSNEPYETEDIAAVASCIMQRHGFDFNQQLQIFKEEEEISEWLQGKAFDKHQDAYICFLNVSGVFWVVFCLLKLDSKIVVLYVDYYGGDIVLGVKRAINSHFPGSVFKIRKTENQIDVHNSGAMALKSMELILEGLKFNKKDYVENFDKAIFSRPQETKTVKESFHTELSQNVKKNLRDTIKELSTEANFMQLVNSLIEYCENYLNIGDLHVQYVRTIQDEFKKKEEDPTYVINEEKIKEAGRQFFKNNYVQDLINNAKTYDSSLKPELNQKEHQIEIAKKYPDQTRKFAELFSWLVNMKDDEERDILLHMVSKSFALDHEKVMKFFEAQRAQAKIALPEEEVEADKERKPRSVTQIENELPEMDDSRNSEDSRDEGVKSDYQLLEELELGADGGDLNDRDDRLKVLKCSLQRVHVACESRWCNASANQVRAWAEGRRAHARRQKEIQVSEAEVEEALAAIGRAHQLSSGGQQLRDTQLLAALACLRGSEGVLCQMKTGEGKTAVISTLAAVEVLLRNTQVDVITTNEVLAEEGFRCRRLFFELLGVSVATNGGHQRSHAAEGSGARACYSADVVYGSMAAFQFDFLRHGCEGQGTRGTRTFGRVIVDEVDSMLIDNGGHIAKLATPFPGLESLRYAHINIWTALFKAEEQVAEAIEKKELQKADENKKRMDEVESQLKKDKSLTTQEALRERRNEEEEKLQKEYEQFMAKVYQEEVGSLKSRIKATNPTKIDLIPGHLRDYASRMEDKWINSALYAKFQCSEDEQYVLRAFDGSSETLVVPVDYINTGVTLRNTQWSDGLHQFVQLKHNLRVQPESMTSAFVSNVGYIKLYGSKVWGLSGTLGSQAEMELLSHTYNVSYAIIPTYKKKVFQEFEGVVVKDKGWGNVVSLDSVVHTLRQRSTLVICKTIKEVRFLEKSIHALLKLEKLEETKVKTYADEDGSKIVNEEVGPNEIIIATNIAGRGTDLKTTKELEQNGGLHVCVCFLPANQRVEDQAFGRTSRQGNAGTAQLILSESDVSEVGVEIKDCVSVSFIKKKRDQLEKDRLAKIREEELEDIQFHDELFSKFSNLNENFKKNINQNPKLFFLAKDLKEMWAFWLHKKDFRENRLTRRSVDEEFSEFKEAVKNILGEVFVGEGEIMHNPYYSICLADFYLNTHRLASAKKAVLNAINLYPKNSDILHSAYFKLFEIEIESGRQLWERFRTAILRTVPIDIFKFERFQESDGNRFVGGVKSFLNMFSTQKDEGYKKRAKAALEKAKIALGKEVKYIEDNFFVQSEDNPQVNNLSDKCEQGSDKPSSSYLESSQQQPAQTNDFIKILISDNNPLLKQLNSRYIALNTFHEHAKSLLDQIEESAKDNGTTSGLAISTRIPNYLKTEKFGKDSPSSGMLDGDLNEFGLLGLETIFALREVYDVETKVIRRAQVQIAAGVGAAAAGACFPPALFIASPVASTLISEGICDIAVELISQGESEFSEAAYVKGKVISYAISTITLGISVLAQCVNLLDEAIKCCKSLSTWLRKCRHFRTLCNKMANIIDKLGVYFQYLKYCAELSKVSQVRAVTRSEMWWSIMKSSGKSTLKSLLGLVITEKIVTKQLEVLLKNLKPSIKKSVEDSIKKEIKDDDLKGMNNKNLQKLVNDILIGTYGEIAYEILKDVAFGLIRHCHSWKAKIASVGLDSIVSVWEIWRYVNNFCIKLKKQIEKINKSETITESKSGESVADLKAILINALTEKIYGLIMQLAGKYANTFVVNPLMEKGWDKLDSSAQEERKRSEEQEKNFQDILAALETLGLEYGASNVEIEKAWEKALHKIHTDDNMEPHGDITKQFMRANEAHQFLLEFNAQMAQLIELTLSKHPAHGGNIETLSQEEERHFVIEFENGEKQEFGKKYKDNGKSTVFMKYDSPSENTDGHYYIMNNNKEVEVTSSGKYNCFYDAYSALCKSQGIEITSSEARARAEKFSWSNFMYGSLDALSGLLNNSLTKQMYVDAQTSLLVGGRVREKGMDELYPHERKPTTNKHEERMIKLTLSELHNILTKKNEEFENFNPNKVDSNYLSKTGGTVPAMGSNDTKDSFMMGALYVEFNDNTTLKIVCTSGSDEFYTRGKPDFQSGKIDPVNFNFQKEGYKFVDPGNIVNKNIYDMHNRETKNEKFSSCCAAQKAFYQAGEHMKESMKKNPHLKVNNIIMRECLFKKGVTKRMNVSDMRYIASCGNCEKTLPYCNGLSPRK